MFTGLGDLGKDAGQKLEDIESLALRVAREGVVVRRLSLIEESLRARAPVDSLQGEGTAQEVTADTFDTGSIGGQTVAVASTENPLSQNEARSSIRSSARRPFFAGASGGFCEPRVSRRP
jgi:hypothetical protein